MITCNSAFFTASRLGLTAFAWLKREVRGVSGVGAGGLHLFYLFLRLESLLLRIIQLHAAVKHQQKQALEAESATKTGTGRTEHAPLH